MKVSKVTIPDTITMKTRPTKDLKKSFQWWNAGTDNELMEQVLATQTYLQEAQSYRYRQVSVFARLYGNQSLFNFAGSNTTKIDQVHGLPQDRPTFNIIQSAADTLISRITQSRPSPVFLTDNGDYKQRNLGKRLNNFVQGEFYSCKTYSLTETMIRDALVAGTGCIKVFENANQKVGMERRLCTELLTDPNDSIYGDPRQLLEMKLVDREVLKANFPKYKARVEAAMQSYPDQSADASKTVTDQVMVVEAWRLRSGEKSKDGRHVIVCSGGVLIDEDYTKDKFPFVFLHYSNRMLGFWAQGLAEQLMGTQMEINSLLFTISKAIKLVGVPRVFQEMGSKVVKAHNNNDIGVIIEYRGTKPSYEVAPCNAPELYSQLQRMIDYGYQQCGVSTMAASSQKPAGLNSGEAIRSYDDISTDRMAALSKRYDNVFVDLAYLVVDTAKDIAEEYGQYTTIYPGKNGTKKIDLPEADLLEDKFVIQCFNMSSLPRDPAGRMQKVTEMIQSNMITIKEGRRLLDYPDLEQIERLANASEERIYQYLDEIIEDGEYTPPDSFMDLQLANELVVQYYNLYVAAKLEEEKCEMLRTFFSQVQTLKTAATTPAMPQSAPNTLTPNGAATPQPLPQSPLLPNVGVAQA